MNKLLLALVFVIFAFTACKKDAGKKSTAAFNTNKTNYYLQETVSINNTSTNASSYVWDFGDGGTATGISPTHFYTQGGTYKITLTVNGGVTFSKSIKIFNGDASYQIENLVSIALPLVSFSEDASANLTDYQDDGTLQPGATSDTVYTNDSKIFIGGTLPDDSLFIAINPHKINLFSNNVLALTDTTLIYVNSIKQQQTYGQYLHGKMPASKGKTFKQINLFKHTAQ